MGGTYTTCDLYRGKCGNFSHMQHLSCRSAIWRDKKERSKANVESVRSLYFSYQIRHVCKICERSHTGYCLLVDVTLYYFQATTFDFLMPTYITLSVTSFKQAVPVKIVTQCH